MEQHTGHNASATTLAEIDLYHVAGTHESDIIVRELESEFVVRGSNVRLLPIEDGPPITAEDDRTLGIVFPVAVHMTRACVIDFFHHLPPSRGTACFTVSSLAGGYGGGIKLFERMLVRKGYRVIGATDIATPTLLFNAAAEKAKINTWTQQICSETREFASMLYSYKPSFSQRLIESVHTRRRHRIVVDQNKCIDCRMCEAVCSNDKGSCAQCGKCIEGCPVNALAWW